MKVALLTTGDFKDMKGIMNYVQQKIESLLALKSDDIEIDCYFINFYYSFLFRVYLSLKSHRWIKSKFLDKNVYIGDAKYIVVNIRYGCLDSIIQLFRKEYLPIKKIERVAKSLSGYSILTTHQLPCHYIAYITNKIYNIPYVTTWHGSDINVVPQASKQLFDITKMVMESAEINLFVSKGLMRNSGYITTKCKKSHIYTGPSDIFQKYSQEKKLSLRRQYGAENGKVILFCGNLIPIKNVMVLPKVFSLLMNKLPNIHLQFWIVGNGVLENQLTENLNLMGVPYKMFGKLSPSEIPNIMNCADILILPSINEGFPLAIIEARSCGCNVVGSKVGGIPESAGEENTFELDNTFADRITDRMADIIINEEKPVPLDKEMSWESAVEKETNIYKSILK